jgi:hypothetical protein
MLVGKTGREGDGYGAGYNYVGTKKKKNRQTTRIKTELKQVLYVKCTLYRKKRSIVRRKEKKKACEREGCEARMIPSIVGGAYRKKLLDVQVRVERMCKYEESRNGCNHEQWKNECKERVKVKNVSSRRS